MTQKDQQILLHHYAVDMNRWDNDEDRESYRQALNAYERVNAQETEG